MTSSCTMGCTLARGTASVGDCQRACLAISRNGSCDVPAWHFNLCENCPPGCKSPSVDECLAGCAFADGAARGTVPPWRITAVRVVAQTMPVPYAGALAAAADPLLTAVWWTAAYCPKLNMVPSPPLPGALAPSTTALDAILMDRGDRIAWTGDDHVAQAAIMAAFGQFDFVRQQLWNTHNNSQGIATYVLYWCMSVVDYYEASGDDDTLVLYARNIDAKLSTAAAREGSAHAWAPGPAWSPPDLAFVGPS